MLSSTFVVHSRSAGDAASVVCTSCLLQRLTAGRLPMYRSFWLLACFVVAPASMVEAQDYIFRPGPRGFDPSLNRYGTTEAPPTAPKPADTQFDPSKTNVNVEILMPREGSALDAQQWSKTFAEMGFSARVRSPLARDKVEVTERTRGPLRFVTVIGALDSRGKIVFPDRSFSPADAAALKEWLNDLKTYGAQGSPEGQPLWGLSREQFEAVYTELARPVAADVEGLPLLEAIGKLGIAREFPFAFSVAAKQALDGPEGSKGLSRSVRGITAGTSLAFVLNEFGMGFHPARRPDGSLELLIEPLPKSMPDDDEALIVWPIGWEIDERPAPERRSKPVRDSKAVPSNRQSIGGTLLQQREAIGLPSTSVAEALDTIETETGVPILFDVRAASTAGIDLEKVRVSSPPRNTSWNIVLKTVTFPNRLRHDLRRDEAGNPVVVVTSLHRGR